MASCLSLISIYGSFLRHSLSSAGLSSQTKAIDNQTTMHFWGPKPKSSSTSKSNKPPLILIHGFGPAGGFQWRQQIVAFAREFDLYVPDLVCFGGSVTKSKERSQVFQAVCVAKLLEKIGLKRYSIVGTSYGGFVAYHIASMWPERVEKVVIASSAVNLRKKDNQVLVKKAGAEKIADVMLPETRSQLRATIGLTVFKRPYLPDFILNDFIHNLCAENRKEKLELLEGLTLGRSDTVEISPLQQDVLLLWGDHDQIFPLEKAHELKELLGKKAILKVIKNTSHVPNIENARQFNFHVRNFLAGKCN